MTNPLECMDCEWIMPMGTHPEFDMDFMQAHRAQTGHGRFSRRGPVDAADWCPDGDTE